MRWRIYYPDGLTFDGDGEGDLELAPARGVQAIVQKNERGWHTETGGDYYVWKDGLWVAVDIFGLFDYLIETGLVKFGRTITNTEYREIYQRALDDADFGRRDGLLPGERKP